MITLYTFGPAFGLPDPSPFVVKAMVHLKMSGLPYEVDTKGMFKSPKGKLPYLRDGEQLIADSTFIRWHLEDKYKVDLDMGLSAQERATCWAVEKMLEEHMYWLAVYWRWMDEANFRKVSDVFFAKVPGLLRKPIEALVRRRFRGYLHAQGTGRHSEAEMMQLARRGLVTASTLLGDKPYIMGSQPCGTDATLYAFMSSVLCPHFDSPLRQAALGFPNLVAYTERMGQRFFPEGDMRGMAGAAGLQPARAAA